MNSIIVLMIAICLLCFQSAIPLLCHDLLIVLIYLIAQRLFKFVSYGATLPFTFDLLNDHRFTLTRSYSLISSVINISIYATKKHLFT